MDKDRRINFLRSKITEAEIYEQNNANITAWNIELTNLLKEDKIKVIRHHLAPYNPVTKTQKCALCGEIIHDYSKALYAPDENGNFPIEKVGLQVNIM